MLLRIVTFRDRHLTDRPWYDPSLLCFGVGLPFMVSTNVASGLLVLDHGLPMRRIDSDRLGSKVRYGGEVR